MFSVLNRFFGTAADTGHTMGTFISPMGFAVYKPDVTERTNFFTQAAGYTGIRDMKFSCMYKKRIKQTVYDSAVHFIH